MNEGYRWRIGDGSSIDVLGQSWLRNDGDLYIPVNNYPNFMALTVRDLFYPGTRTWNHELVHSLFPPTIASDIMHTPVLRDHGEDKRIWRFTSDGQYTVKSGYRIFCEVVANKNHLKVAGASGPLFGSSTYVPPIRFAHSCGGRYVGVSPRT